MKIHSFNTLNENISEEGAAQIIICDILENEELEFTMKWTVPGNGLYARFEEVARITILLGIEDPSVAAITGEWVEKMNSHPFVRQISEFSHLNNKPLCVHKLNQTNLILKRINAMTGYELNWYTYENRTVADAMTGHKLNHLLHLDFIKN